jgi:hypothetical protein
MRTERLFVGLCRYWCVNRPRIFPGVKTPRRLTMSCANALWGAPRIHGELLKLGFEVVQSTVAPPLAAAVSGLADVSQQSRRRHRGDRALCPADDSIPNSVLSCHCAPRTTTLGVDWRDGKPNRGVDFAPSHRGFPWDHAPRYLIWYRDTSYGPVFLQRIRAMGIRGHPITPRLPGQKCLR